MEIPTKTKSRFSRDDIIDQIDKRSHSLQNDKAIDLLMDKIGDSRIVMLGEASHGTHEYYKWRANLSKRLINEKGFNFIAVEGDWPDCYRLNRYVKNYSNSGDSAVDVLKSFKRWPTWMWANWEIVAFSEWMYKHNSPLSVNKKVGFYGLDVYSLWESMESIMSYLKKEDPNAYKTALKAFECFEPYKKNEGQDYAKATVMVPELCTDEVVDLLKEIQRKLPSYNTDHENAFSTQQNALVAVNAEKYYRAMIRSNAHSWNIRDEHMMTTLDKLLEFHGKNSKAIVWAHNTHVGDARATDMSSSGMYNIGELARIKNKEEGVFIVGFGSYQGSVIAGNKWGSPMRVTPVPEAISGSWEEYLHEVGVKQNLLFMSDFIEDTFMENLFGHRAIGVVYNPQLEQFGNYVPSILPLRYDAFIYLENTQALKPLHIVPDGHQIPETYPFGI